MTAPKLLAMLFLAASLVVSTAATMVAQTPASVVQITTDGRATGSVALSADGKLLAFTNRGEGGVMLRDTSTAKDRKLDVGPGFVHSLAFPPDGKSIYFSRTVRPGVQGLFEAKLDGGEVKMRIDDVDSSVTFSPDGKSIAFLRNVPSESKLHLRIWTDGKERDLAAWSMNYEGFTELAWSPDGKQIVAVVRQHSKVLLFVSLSNGEIKEVAAPGMVHGLSWPSTTGGLLVLMGGKTRVNAFQLWRYALPAQNWIELTNDESGFRPSQIAANSDGTLVAATRMTKVKTGVEDLLSWVGLGDAGPRTNPNVVLIRLNK